MAVDPRRLATVRVASWNVWFRFGDWRARAEAIAQVLAEVDADVVCLQESWSEVAGTSQAGLLTDRLGLADHRFVARYADDGVWIGNALLSRWPITATRCWTFPARPGRGRFRSALALDIATPGGRLRVATGHLTHRRARRLNRFVEVRMLRDLALAGAGGTPVVIAGDLNADPGSPELALFSEDPAHRFVDAWDAAGDGGPGWTFDGNNPLTARSRFPDRRLDYLLVRPVDGAGTPVATRLAGLAPVDGVQAADHYVLVSDLAMARIPARPEPEPSPA